MSGASGASVARSARGGGTVGATAPALQASPTTARARAFVADHLPAARALGVALAGEIDDPGAFVAAARAGLARLADPTYLTGQRLVAPGIGPTLGIRSPLLDAVVGGLRGPVRGLGSGRLLVVADALARQELRELRWMAIHLLRWILPDDPERGWQVLRRLASEADDWITVDTLAEAVAEGILREPYRWAELEQLVFSPGRWERRLVGSAIANLPHVDHGSGRTVAVATRGLDLVAQLIGDAEPDVQKALSWSLRELARVEPGLVGGFCRKESVRAAEGADGHRAWVLRETAPKLRPDDAAAVRRALAGIRRTSSAPSTSTAAATAAAFAAAGPGARDAAHADMNRRTAAPHRRPRP